MRWWNLIAICFTPLSILFADEVILKDGRLLKYRSIFSFDESGVTLEVENGLEFFKWKEFSREEANRISDGKYGKFEDLKISRQINLKKGETYTESISRNNRNERVSSGPSSQKGAALDVSLPPNKVKQEVRKRPVRFDSPAFENLLIPKGEIWTMKPSEFMEAQRDRGFIYTSELKRGIARSTHTGFTFLGFKLWEVVIQFDKDCLNSLTLFLYNRGDAGEWTRKGFEDLLKSVEAKLSGWLKLQPVIFKNQYRTSNVKIQRKVWGKSHFLITLEWSATRNKDVSFRPEFIRLKIAERDPSLNLIISSREDSQKQLSVVDLSSHIKQENGDFFYLEGVPMIDQGKKGYCAVASAERILRYYGKDIDQHELAQLAETSISEGTERAAMRSALMRVGRRENVKIKVLYEMDTEDFLREIKRYNQLAKRKNLPRVSEYVRTFSGLLSQIDINLLRDIRLKKTGDIKSFKHDIERHIQAGIPLLWSVVLGIVSETPKIRGYGGHMRLIIGFDKKKQEILYTDSWGPGHEFKRMSFGNAWAITTGVYIIEPKNMLEKVHG